MSVESVAETLDDWLLLPRGPIFYPAIFLSKIVKPLYPSFP
jgi:hypothetical protein